VLAARMGAEAGERAGGKMREEKFEPSAALEAGVAALSVRTGAALTAAAGGAVGAVLRAVLVSLPGAARSVFMLQRGEAGDGALAASAC
jgi:hypothetical protein